MKVQYAAALQDGVQRDMKIVALEAKARSLPRVGQGAYNSRNTVNGDKTISTTSVDKLLPPV
jgi:hypothetical protein